MKKMKLILPALLLSMMASNEAFSLSLALSANPFYDPSYDLYTSSGGPFTAEYIATATGTGSLKEFIIWFGGPVDERPPASPIFTSASLVSGSISTAGWTGGSILENGVTGIRFTADTPADYITAGQSIVFRVTYSLAVAATTPGDWWSSHGIWSQSYGWLTAGSSYYSAGSGSLAPEPSTLLLLGSGLASLGVVKRFRQRRKRAI